MTQKKRTLLVTSPQDFFMGKLLRSVVLGPTEPLPIDVLRFGRRVAPARSPLHVSSQVAALPLPPGVDVHELEDLHHAVAPSGLTLDQLLDRYERVAVYSIYPENAELINHLAGRSAGPALSVICSDDEVDRHWHYQRLVADNPSLQAELRQRCLYPSAVEAAFEAVPTFFIGRQPWESMLRTGRRSDLTLIPWVPPILNGMPGFVLPPRSAASYRLVVHPKPSVSREQFLAVARDIVARNRGQALELLSFRNDMPTLSEVDGVWLRCFPYPLDEPSYHRAIAASHGIVIVPRGGLSTLRDAVRYGLDLLSPVAGTPNESALCADMGLRMAPLDALSPGAYLDRAAQRSANQVRLAAYEFDAIAAFRREYL